MSNIPDHILLIALFILLLGSAFFSASETGLLAVNRYRIRHLARSGHKGARRVERLLSRVDHLLGAILLSNNLINNYAATIAALLAISWFGSTGATIAPLVFTLVLLIFSEVTPKTYAAHKPETVSFIASVVLRPVMVVFAPAILAITGISNLVLRLFRIKPNEDASDDLSPEELRTVVNEAGGLIPAKHQRMLLNILDLEKVKVEDIMIPRSEIDGVDLADELVETVRVLSNSQHTRLPIYRGDLNHIVGILHMRNVSRFLLREDFSRADIMQLSDEPYFIPEGTTLHQQLINFQAQKRRLGIVVDEYGDVLGLTTLEDILEEIVGEFTTDLDNHYMEIMPQADGSHVIDGSTPLRDINRRLRWQLPVDGPKTLNGLILEELQRIPEHSISLRVGRYVIEVVQVKDNRVRTAKVRQLEAPKRRKPRKKKKH
ncbi:MAG TPA: HlyC/CorC family transporter [Alcanivoracaceae bacterium]|nr:HlyC/CorC family transporter [Alcanivoracaceae bacterium]